MSLAHTRMLRYLNATRWARRSQKAYRAWQRRNPRFVDGPMGGYTFPPSRHQRMVHGHNRLTADEMAWIVAHAYPSDKPVAAVPRPRPFMRHLLRLRQGAS